MKQNTDANVIESVTDVAAGNYIQHRGHSRNKHRVLSRDTDAGTLRVTPVNKSDRKTRKITVPGIYKIVG